MAESVSHLYNGSIGDNRYSKYRVEMGASTATLDVPTNVGMVAFAIVNPMQGSAAPSMRYNSGLGNTAVAGNLALFSGTSAGSYIVVAFGPRGA